VKVPRVKLIMETSRANDTDEIAQEHRKNKELVNRIEVDVKARFVDVGRIFDGVGFQRFLVRRQKPLLIFRERFGLSVFVHAILLFAFGASFVIRCYFNVLFVDLGLRSSLNALQSEVGIEVLLRHREERAQK
jgi:hypothetical protein